MFRKGRLLTILLVISLIFGATSDVFAGGNIEPPTGTERLSGPAILGTVTLDGQNLTFVGKCKGQDVTLSTYFPVDLSTVTAESMVDFRVPESGPAGCHSEYGGEDLIVNTVMKFNHLGTVVQADVVLLFVIPK